MRALLAVLSARSRSRMGSIVDRCAALCFEAGRALLALRDRLDPAAVPVLTPDAGARLLANVLTRIAAESTPPVPPYNPAAFTASKPVVLLPWQGGRH